MGKQEKIRVPQKTKEKIETIRQIENPYKALVHFVQLVQGNYYKSEIGTPSKYDQKSGKPIEWKWSSHEKIKQIDDNRFLYSGEVYFPAREHITMGGVEIEEKRIFHPKVLSFIKKNLVDKDPTYLEADGKKYIISTDATHSGGGNYPVKRVPGITIRPLNKQMSLERLINLKGNI
ncbi:MAG: hypothetical protein PHH54_03140 [Candidatus Nanoarchaeia archaeon]|nr:hypothetical protein [Candidatus Nanoarchaeia archaeon]MDD5740956.1 hypothetical protein [Candidatus Nanoarchaeia archaeon]